MSRGYEDRVEEKFDFAVYGLVSRTRLFYLAHLIFRNTALLTKSVLVQGYFILLAKIQSVTDEFVYYLKQEVRKCIRHYTENGVP